MDTPTIYHAMLDKGVWCGARGGDKTGTWDTVTCVRCLEKGVSATGSPAAKRRLETLPIPQEELSEAIASIMRRA